MIPFLSIATISYFSASNSIEKEVISKLQTSRDLKNSQITDYFSMMEKNIQNLTENRNIHTLYDKLVHLHEVYDVKGDSAFNIIDKKDVKDVYDEFDGYFGDFIKKNQLYDLFLICAKHGHVMYTVTKESDLGENLVTGSLQNSGLARAWQKTISTRQAYLTDMESYAPSNGEPAMFMSLPIIEGDVLEGVIAVQIDPENIRKIMQERTGMGETGETYLVGPDKLMRSDSYLSPKHHSIKASFTNPSKGSVDTEASRAVLSGKTETKIVIDYNGNPVVSSYTPFKYRDLSWGLIAEMDVSEVFASVNDLEIYL